MAGVRCREVGIEEIRGRLRTTSLDPVPVFRRLAGKFDTGDHRVTDRARPESRRQIGLACDDAVRLIARFLVGSANRGAGIAFEPRRGNQRIALRVARPEDRPEAQQRAEVVFHASRRDVRLRALVVPRGQTVEIAEVHRGRMVGIGAQRHVGVRHPGNAVVRQVVLIEVCIIERHARGRSDPECE